MIVMNHSYKSNGSQPPSPVFMCEQLIESTYWVKHILNSVAQLRKSQPRYIAGSGESEDV